MLPSGTPALLDSYGQLPLSFEANRGQADAGLGFLARGSGYTIGLTGDAAYLSLGSGSSSGTVLQMQLAGGNTAAAGMGLDLQPGVSNYFVGNDPSQWHTAIPNYARVAYHDVYPGIDVVWYGSQRQLEYDFVVAAGADPGQVRLRFDGADSLSLDADGNLLVHTAAGNLAEHAPVLYQQDGGPGGLSASRTVVTGGYVLDGGNEVSVWVGGYDAGRRLLIDPVLSYSTFLGGSGDERGFGIAVDAAGNAYVTGRTNSTNFPTTAGALQTAFGTGLSDAFVSKLNAAGTALVYSTFLGGSLADEGFAIAVDGAGNAYVTGDTQSSNFPTTAGAFQTVFGGNDAFVTKLNATGTALVYSTFLGGSNSTDVGRGIALDAAGNAYVTGVTLSTDFPTTPGAFQHTFAGGFFDAFVTKLNVAGTALVYSTFLGGSLADEGFAIAVDAAGSAYVTGETNSTNFPTTAGAFQTTLGTGNPQDAFVTKLNATGTSLVYSTFLSGSSGSVGEGIAVDAAGSAYVTGEGGPSFPTTPGAFQTTYGGNLDAFVTRLNATGTGVVYSTFVGGSSEDRGDGIALDAAGNAYVTGQTSSGNFPTTPGAFQPTFGGGGSADAFVTILNAAGSTLVNSTYLGSSGVEVGERIAVDAAGNAYLTGFTDSTNFPTTAGAFQTSLGGNSDAFVAKFSGSSVPPPPAAANRSLVVGTDAGSPPEVRVYDAITTTLRLDFFAYDGDFRGGVRVAAADINGDAIPDVITVPGPGAAAEVKVFDGATGALLRHFYAFPSSLTTGFFVAAGDLNKDGFADIVVGVDAGAASQVRAFSGVTAGGLYDFYAYGDFRGGVRVAVGDVDGDGFGDIVTATGPGMAALVRVFSGANDGLLRTFYALPGSYLGGIYVAAGDGNQDGFAEVIVGAGSGSPEVCVFDGPTSTLLRDFYAYDGHFQGGVRVGFRGPSGTSPAALLTAPGPVPFSTSFPTIHNGRPAPVPVGLALGPLVNELDAATLVDLDSFYAYEPNVLDGVFIGGA
jgi:hypothetical protein